MAAPSGEGGMGCLEIKGSYGDGDDGVMLLVVVSRKLRWNIWQPTNRWTSQKRRRKLSPRSKQHDKLHESKFGPRLHTRGYLLRRFFV